LGGAAHQQEPFLEIQQMPDVPQPVGEPVVARALVWSIV
jgi:hypothetical protein